MTAPWASSVNSAPWTVSQQVYNRTVAIHRNKSVAGSSDSIGNVGYSGAEQGVGSEGELVLFTGLPATIQVKSAARTSINRELIGDAVTKPVWAIFIPASSIAQYSVRDRDIIIDDEGYRYEVGSNEWTSLGYQLIVVRQEA